ncbi:MAG: hypothetical protein KBS39_06225 [Lachnospiraceae bacterium]|nr:hypothetical protein [Candidatus Hippenecus merdae]
MKGITETRAIIDDRSNRLGMKFSDAAAIAGMAPKTLREKCADPGRFSIYELKHLFDGLKLTDLQKDAIIKEALQ